MPENLEQLLNSVHLKSLLPIDWDAVTELGRQINLVQGTPYHRSDLADIKPPAESKAVIVMVASVVVNFQHPDIPYLLPTKEQVKKLRPWLNSLEKLLGKLSPKWSVRFGRYIESRGQEAVVGAGKLIIETAELCRPFQNPRKQFFNELGILYGLVHRPIMKEGWLYEYPMPIEEKIENLFSTFRYGRSSHFPSVNAENFPLLFTLMEKFNFPPHTLSDSVAGIVGAEMMHGIATFLWMNGANNVPTPPSAQEFDLFDPDTWMRGMAETFYSERIEMVKQKLPTILTLILQILPESGPELANTIYTIATRIYKLGRMGVPSEEIARHVFKK